MPINLPDWGAGMWILAILFLIFLYAAVQPVRRK